MEIDKEIARVLGVALITAMTLRYRLRSKFGLKQNKVNMRFYLKSIEF